MATTEHSDLEQQIIKTAQQLFYRKRICGDQHE